MLKVGINGILLSQTEGDIPSSILNLTQSLARLNSNIHVTLFVPSGFKQWRLTENLSNISCSRSLLGRYSHTVRLAWEHLWFPFKVISYGLDVLHFPVCLHPPVRSIPTVMTVHSVAPLQYPQLCNRRDVHYFKRFMKISIERATRIIVPSHSIAEEVQRIHHRKENSIDIIPVGGNTEYAENKKHPDIDIRTMYGIGNTPMVVYSGTAEPAGGVSLVIKAFFAACLHRNLPHVLVLAGKTLSRNRKIRRLVNELGERFSSRIIMTGAIKPLELVQLYDKAQLLMYPSLIEGLSIPVWNALLRGTPVLLSKEPSLLETFGQYAHFAERADLKSLREVIETLLLESKKREMFREAGQRYALQCSGENYAKQVESVYRRAIADFNE